MLKWIIGALVVALLLKRNEVSSATTSAFGAPPEGNISTWGNSGATVGSVDPGNRDIGATANKSAVSDMSPTKILRPTVLNFRTRGFYSGQRYEIPGRA